jgi:CO/xanthine dehydrogenase FAD-binding subunit
VPLAGGTDVVVDLRRGAAEVHHLVSLRDLAELREIRVEGGELRIGALSTPALLESSEEVRKTRPELLDAVEVFGNPQVRNRATLGGNLCTAASCGDLAPLLCVLDARVLVESPGGRRELAVQDLFGDHRRTVLEPGEILADVVVPARVEGEGAAYATFGRRAANFITVAGVAAYLRMEGGGCAEARLALGAVSPTPVRVPTAEEALVGSELDQAVLGDAARAASKVAQPISDVRASVEHRRELVEALTVRALRRARGRAE